MPNLVLAPFYAIADLTVASHQHKMPPEDSWKRPQDGGQEEEDNYKRGVTDRTWLPMGLSRILRRKTHTCITSHRP